jgi:hypothetical protein
MGMKEVLFRAALRQPLLTATLRFPLFRLFSDAGLLVVSTPLQFSEKPLSG